MNQTKHHHPRLKKIKTVIYTYLGSISLTDSMALPGAALLTYFFLLYHFQEDKNKVPILFVTLAGFLRSLTFGIWF